MVVLTSAQSWYFFPVPWRGLNWIWEAVMRYMVCGQAVCVYVFVWTVIMSVCTCLLVYLCACECVQTWSDCCVWDLFQWLNTAPIVVSPKPDRRFLRTAWLKNIPQNVNVHTNHTNLWDLGVWILWEKKKLLLQCGQCVMSAQTRSKEEDEQALGIYTFIKISPQSLTPPVFALRFPTWTLDWREVSRRS